ncbi:MAG TPA: HEAT repeat domain-containing protein [Gemmatimonadales bacterium]|nr:HEAT repeat domain-containing protein [Gemmatimonadales bacterium]
MSAPLTVVGDLWQVVKLLREKPNAKEEHKNAFRQLMMTLGVSDLHLEATPEGLAFQSVLVQPETPGADELNRTMLMHGVGSIELPEGTAAAPLLSLCKALAQAKSTYVHLDAFITTVGEPGASQFKFSAPSGVTTAPSRVTPLPTPPAPPAGSPPPRPPGLPRNLPPDMRMYNATDQRGTASQPLRASEQLAAQLGEGVFSSEDGGMVQMPTAAGDVGGRIGELLATLERDPTGPLAGNILQELVTISDTSVQQEKWAEVAQISGGIVRAEAVAGGPTSPNARPFNLVLKRILPRRTLEETARLLSNKEAKADALAILSRMGDTATDVLLDLLVLAPTVDERRSYFDALVHSRRGSEQVVRMLDHHEWFVVRNIAELCGELKLESAVPELGRLLSHSEERVRKAAVVALAKIGTSATVEPLRQALKDPVNSVRVQALVLIDGKHNRALALRIATMLAEEENIPPEVQKEMCNALGRTATPEGVQALVRQANPPRKLLRKPPTQPRLWAVEGLRLAAAQSQPAKAALEQLKGDDDKEVAAAATRALG